MKKYLFISIAALFNSAMDSLAWNFGKSVFRALNPEYWNPNVSWIHVEPFLGWVRLDAWHLAKFGMLFFIAAAIHTNIDKRMKWLEYICLLFTWGIVFEIGLKIFVH